MLSGNQSRLLENSRIIQDFKLRVLGKPLIEVTLKIKVNLYAKNLVWQEDNFAELRNLLPHINIKYTSPLEIKI
jgi:hypothetical protein